MKRFLVTKWAFAFLGLIAIGILVVWYVINLHRGVEITRVEYPPFKVFFRTSGINGFLGIDFFSETRKEYLWSVSCQNFVEINQVTYGILPPRSRQHFPRAGEPKPLVQDGKILIRVNYQYDEFLAPRSASKIWAFQIEKGNKIKSLGDFSSTVLPLLPSEKAED